MLEAPVRCPSVPDAPSLRDYQATLQRDGAAALEDAERGRLLLQSETGSGKTITAVSAGRSMIVDRSIEQISDPQIPGLVVGWLTHSDELRDQSSEDMGRFEVPVVLAKDLPIRNRSWTPGAVTVFSPTMRMPAPPCRKRDEEGRFVDEHGEPLDEEEDEPPILSVLFVDEAHHSLAPTWRRQIEAGWDVVIGLTATPWHLKATKDFRTVWDQLVTGPHYEELLEVNALCDFKIVYPTNGAIIERRTLKKDSSGEYTDKTVVREVTRLLSTDAAYDEWLAAVEKAELVDRRTILFAPTVESATQAADLFNKEGVASAVLSAKTPKAERREIVKRFRAGEITVLSNVAVAAEGFDCPAAAVVLLLRPTASLGLHRQMLGRTLRPSEGKTKALIVDLVGNCLEHGGPDRKINWSLAPRGKRGKGGGFVALPCPWKGCDSVNASAANHCRDCGGQLQFRCGSCYRLLLWRQFMFRSWRREEKIGGEYTYKLEEMEFWRDMMSVSHLRDNQTCRECFQVQQDHAAAIERFMNGVLNPVRWKFPKYKGWVSRGFGNIRVARRLPDHDDSCGTKFVWITDRHHRNHNYVYAYPLYEEAPCRENRWRKQIKTGDSIHCGSAGSREEASKLAAIVLAGAEYQHHMHHRDRNFL